MDGIMDYINAFWVGGLICVVGQILIDKTKLTPARILTGFVVAGVILGAVGLYKPLAEFAFRRRFVYKWSKFVIQCVPKYVCFKNSKPRKT